MGNPGLHQAKQNARFATGMRRENAAQLLESDRIAAMRHSFSLP
jgi:hypothetical protein